MKRAWALGTTAIPQGVDREYCVCALTEEGEIEYEAMLVPQSMLVPPGQVLEALPGHTWTSTEKNDLPGLVARVGRNVPTWTLQELVDAERRPIGWTSPEIFRDAVVKWYFSGSPQSPSCSLAEYRGMKCWTSIVRLGFTLGRIEKLVKGNLEPYYRPGDSDDAEWTIKYDGSQVAPERLPQGTIIAVFVSRDRYNEYAYLKIGSILKSV